jgi:leucine dehydrogenase
MKAQMIQMPGYESIATFQDEGTNFKSYIAVHSTVLGPAVGGLRMRPYTSESDALRDVLQLSQAMTFKSAMAGLPLGGGKSVIIGDPKRDKSSKLWKRFAECLEQFDGNYIAAEDMGTTPEDMDEIAKSSRHVMGRSVSCGGVGNPAPFTAKGVLIGIRAALQWRFGESTLKGVRVAVQGVGAVGMNLVEALHQEGASITVGDPCEELVKQCVEKFSAHVVTPEEIYRTICDLFVPCAMGGILSTQTVNELRCAVVAGSANNQLSSLAAGDAMEERGILYAPDYVINVGGLIAITVPYLEMSDVDRDARIDRISDRLQQVFTRSEQAGIPPNEAANQLAEEFLDKCSSQISRSTKRNTNNRINAFPVIAP